MKEETKEALCKIIGGAFIGLIYSCLDKEKSAPKTLRYTAIGAGLGAFKSCSDVHKQKTGKPLVTHEKFSETVMLVADMSEVLIAHKAAKQERLY